MSQLSDLQKRVYKQATDKGFGEGEPESGIAWKWLLAARLTLVHSEISEALEEIRVSDDITKNHLTAEGKLKGVPSELADVVIRIMTFCEKENIDLEAAIYEKLDYNAGREHMHGGKQF